MSRLPASVTVCELQPRLIQHRHNSQQQGGAESETAEREKEGRKDGRKGSDSPVNFSPCIRTQRHISPVAGPVRHFRPNTKSAADFFVFIEEICFVNDSPACK